jgi:hypothetical protein
MRILADEPDAHFNFATDIVDLGFTPLIGEIDLHTTYSVRVHSYVVKYYILLTSQ